MADLIHERSVAPGRISVRVWTQPRALLAWSVLLAALMTVMEAPEGSPWQALVAYPLWFAQVGAGLFLATLATLGLQRLGLDRLPGWAQLLGGGAYGALLFAPVALLLEGLASVLGLGVSDDWQRLAEEANGLAAVPGVLLSELGSLALPYLLCWLLVNAVYLRGAGAARAASQPLEPVETPERTAGAELVAADGGRPDRPEFHADPPSAPEQAPPSGGLIDQLPQALGVDIVLLKADVNYLHVYTRQGHTMLLYSLARAAEELGAQGLRVHRSYWVARHHVVRVRRGASGLVCQLADGQTVPVSRRRQAEVIAEFGRDFSRSPVTGSGPGAG